jgi:hypothetical protein
MDHGAHLVEPRTAEVGSIVNPARWQRLKSAALHLDAARDMAVVVLPLMKAASSLSDEQGLPGRVAGLRELQSLAAHYLEWRRPVAVNLDPLRRSSAAQRGR